jgi:hypothetical protein
MVDPLVQIYPHFCLIVVDNNHSYFGEPRGHFISFIAVQADSSVRIRATDIDRYEVDPKEGGMRGTVGASARLAPARIE